jgi:hypothetical protein
VRWVITGVVLAFLLSTIVLVTYLVQQVDGLSKNLDATRQQVRSLGVTPVAPPARDVRANPAVSPSPIPGPAGLPGSNGESGRNGQPGVTGSPGVAGSPGPAGSSGPPGPAGPTGPGGADGKDGQGGKDGATGASGPPGASCPEGYSFQSETINGNHALICEPVAAPSPSESPAAQRSLAVRPTSSPSPSAPGGGGDPFPILPLIPGVLVGFVPPHWLLRRETL